MDYNVYSPQRIRVRYSALVEQQIYELACIHPGIRVGVSNDRGNKSHYQYFGHGVLAKLGVLAVTAPVNVRLDEYCCYTALQTNTCISDIQVSRSLVILHEECNRIEVVNNLSHTLGFDYIDCTDHNQ